MFKITEEQMTLLAEGVDARIRQRLRRCVTEVFPQLAALLGHGTSEGTAFGDWLEKVLALCDRYGIDEPADQAVFLALAAATVEVAPTRPGFLNFSRTVLERKSTPGSVKLAWIEQRLASLAESDVVAARMLPQMRAARAHFP